MTREQIIAEFYEFRVRVWEKASSEVAGQIKVWKKDGDLLERVAGLLQSIPDVGSGKQS